MLGRAVILAAGSFLLTSGAFAQGSPSQADRPATVAQKADAAQQPLSAEPDPLTPPEVKGPPPAAPGEPVAAASPVAEPVDAVVTEIRRRIAVAPRGRETSADAADRAALVALYESRTQPAWSDVQGLNSRAKLAIEEIRRADDWGLKAAAFDLPSLSAGEPTAQARADAEIKLGMAILRYARQARGGRLDPQSVSKLFDRRPQPFEPGSLIRAAAASEAPDAYLRNLHPRHAGFRNLQKALVTLRHAAAEAAPQPEPAAEAPAARSKGQVVRKTPPASRSEQIQRIVANMERWRWMPDDLGGFHVWNNVPEQTTLVFKNGKVVFEEKIVVGKADTPTPNFSADMQFVIFQPEWGVPNGIKNNEIAPLLRRASAESGGWFGGSDRTPSTVLARHGLRVSVGGQVVNPDSVNWNSVDVNRFNFIQPSGPQNVLGVVKFRFPNKHDVYMHDTPQKNLFSSPVRAFSHGCMRVQNPVRFAEVLLEHDKGWSSDRVRGMVPRGGEVKLSTQIPVHNVYFTAIADQDGKVKTFSDLYGSDTRVISALEGRAISVPSRGEPAVDGQAGEQVAAARPKSDRQARKRNQHQTTTASFNPFAGLFGN